MNKVFRQGIRHGIPIALGYLSVSFAFGMKAVGDGLTMLQAVLISMTNLTSAGQIAAVPLMVSGASLAEMALTQLTINLRYALMSLSLSSPEAKARGYKENRFSFNVKGGRCEACQGDGMKRIEMHFLPDIYVPCDVCQGHRYNRETLEVTWQGKNISEVLEMTVEEALGFFENHPQILRKLETLYDVGLGYMKLGQASTTLSGGEAQRVKLATELSRKATGKTIYLLDEPTTGLHMADVDRLIQVLQRLTDAGNTVPRQRSRKTVRALLKP